MAFCKNCGTDLNGAKFCSNCGASAAGEVAAHGYAAPVGADVRQRSLVDMENMLKYFGAKKQWYDDFDAVSAEVADRSARSFGGWIVGAVISLIIGIFSKAIFFFILPAPFIALFILLKKKNSDKLKIATDRQNKIMNRLQTYYDEYGYCPVGLEYTKPSTLQALYDLVRKGRASNPGDAINIYLADIEQAEMRRLQEEATAAAKETAKNTKKIARTSRKAAIYSGASFWFK